MYFMLEWSSQTCGLIFSDDNSSEYRALAKESPEDLTDETRKAIAFGEYAPLEVKYCLSKEVALKALREFFEDGQRPDWLEYEYVE